jgi:hypothetical protein
MSTLPELRGIEATITKLRAERDQLGGSLVMLLEALGPRPQTRNPDELELIAERRAAVLAAALRKAGSDPALFTPQECIDALAESVRYLSRDSQPAPPDADEELNDLDAYGFVMACPPGEARSATDPDGRTFTWDRSGS